MSNASHTASGNAFAESSANSSVSATRAGARPRVYIDGASGTTGLQITERLARRADIELLSIDPEKRRDEAERRVLLNSADLVFFCLPDDEARRGNALITNEKTRVIDASTAHRTADGWVYGLPELSENQRNLIRRATRVSNPGCHATGVISLLAPLVKSGFLNADAPLCITSITGYTGGGKPMIAEYETACRQEHWELDAPRVYALGMSHKHLPEIMRYSGLTKTPAFMPIVGDYPQGMQVLIPLHSVNLHKNVDRSLCNMRDSIFSALKVHYSHNLNIDVLDTSPPFAASNVNADTDKLTLRVLGSDEIILLTAQFNNLGKGAAGAAIQNMNLMLGFEELAGIDCE